MYLVKKFENYQDVLQFYKDNINWKFFNYLSDRLTKYEDIGCYVRIGVFYIRRMYDKRGGENNDYQLVYYKTSECDGDFTINPNDIISNVLYYKIRMYDNSSEKGEEDMCRKYLSEFLKKIEEKCNIIESDVYLIVTPKISF